MRKRTTKTSTNPAYDLFGEIPVTEEDLFLWVAAVAPRWLTPERSYRGYVKSWDVAGKVRAAKLSGRFYDIVNQPAHPWHARLALNAMM
jgi:hypothetical protein